MKLERCVKESFVVIGKEGSTNDGAGFIEKLWENANANFTAIAHLAKKDENGGILGIWGAMSDFSVPSIRGKMAFGKDCILPGLSARTIQRHQKAGRSG